MLIDNCFQQDGPKMKLQETIINFIYSFNQKLQQIGLFLITVLQTQFTILLTFPLKQNNKQILIIKYFFLLFLVHQFFEQLLTISQKLTFTGSNYISYNSKSLKGQFKKKQFHRSPISIILQQNLLQNKIIVIYLFFINQLTNSLFKRMSSKAKSKNTLQKDSNMPEMKIMDYDTRSQPPLCKYQNYDDTTSKDQNYLDKTQTAKPIYRENILVCLSCLSDEFPLQQYIKEGLHEGHEIMRLSEAQIMLHKKMLELDNKFDTINKSYVNNRERITKLKKQLLNTLKDLKQNLKKQFQDLKNTLQTKESQIVRCAEIMISTKYQDLDQSDQLLQKNLKNLADLEDIFKKNKGVSYENYSLKKSKLDSLIIQSEELPQKPSIEIDFISFSKILNEIEVQKNKIANICLNNHMNTISLNTIAGQYELYQEKQKHELKKTYNRPTIASIGDELVHDQYSSSIFLSRVQAKKLIEGKNGDKGSVKRITSPKKSNDKQKQGAFEEIMRLNSHRDNFHSREKLTERRSRSNKMIQIGNYLKDSFKK